MAAFAILTQAPNAELERNIATAYKDRWHGLSENAWLVADTNKTTQEVCQALNIKPGSISAIVLKIDSYFGAAQPSIWDWLKVKGVGP